MLLFISFLYGIVLFYLFPYFLFSSGLLFIAASAFLAFKKKFVLTSVVAVGVFYAFIRFSPPVDSLDVWNRELRVTGHFAPKAEIPTDRLPDSTKTETFVIDSAVDEDSGEEVGDLHDKEANVSAEFDADAEEEYELLLKTGRDRTRMNPGAMKSMRLYGSVVAASERRPVSFSVSRMFNKYRHDLNSYVLERFNGDAGALIAAVTTGEMSYLSDDVKQAFSITGLAHILSISGTHFGLFSVMLFGCFVFCIRRLPYLWLQRLTLYLTPQQAAAILTFPFMLMYLGISGGSVPAVRSFIMIGLSLVGLLLGRKGFWLNSLFFAACIIVAWQPDALLSISFQLSFLAVLFIGVAVEETRKLEGAAEEESGENKLRRIARFLKGAIMVSLAASLGTAPLVAYHFHYFSLISPLANLIATPLIGSVLVALALISSFVFLATGSYLFAPLVGSVAELSMYLVKAMSRIPHSDIRVHAFPVSLCIFFYLCCLLYLTAGRKKILLLAAITPFFIYAIMTFADKKGLSVTFLDVGQGDSAVVEFGDSKVIVVDTGRTGRETVSYLRYLGKREIDALVLTHIHPDHTGGIRYITDRFKVRELWDNGMMNYKEDITFPKVRRRLSRGDLITFTDYTITVLHPYREYYSMNGNEYDEENDLSLVLKVTDGRNSVLLTGDIEDEAEENLSHLGRWLRSDVIKIPHHGSRSSANDAFLSEVAPSVAVISVGRDNTFGHPNPQVLQRLNGTTVLRTDKDGAIRLTGGEHGVSISRYRDYICEKADDIGQEMENIRKLFCVW